MSDWDKLTEAQKVAFTRKRKLSGHTSVGEYQRILKEQVRYDALDQACTWLAANGFPEASAALEAAAFEKAA